MVKNILFPGRTRRQNKTLRYIKRLFGYEYYQEASGFEGKVFLREGSVQIKTTEVDVALAHHKN